MCIEWDVLIKGSLLCFVSLTSITVWKILTFKNAVLFISLKNPTTYKDLFIILCV